MARIVVITGTPGVGKTKLVEQLKRRMKRARVISANEIVGNYRLFSGRDRFGTRLVNLKGLEKKLNSMIAEDKTSNPIILDGHILCDLKIRNAIVIVVREHLKTMRDRLMKRRYPIEKMRDNIVSEAIDYCGVNATQNYKHVYEVISSERNLVPKVIQIITHAQKKKPSINLLEELIPMIKEDRRLGF